LLLTILFTALIYFCGKPFWLPMGVVLAALSLWPARRRVIVAAGTLFWLVRYPYFSSLFDFLARGFRLEPDEQDLQWVMVLAFFAGAALVLQGARKYGRAWPYHRPVRNLLVLYGGLILVPSVIPFGRLPLALYWSFLVVFGQYLWFLAYSLQDTKGRERSLPLGLLTFRPFWGSSNVPFPKGEAYLRRIEVKTDRELAVSMLKGIKLMLWATVLIWGLVLFDELVHNIPGPLHAFLRWLPRRVGVPSLDGAIRSCAAGQAIPRWACWAAVVANFSRKMLFITGYGHFIIAVCRFAGFQALRNTRRPLSSTTISEFYNRLYYYFKELLVEMFFFPTYLRCFRDRPRLRIFFATLMAAGFGNILFHYLRDFNFIVVMGPWRALLAFQVYIFYGLLLGTAIGISQIRALGRRVPPRGPWPVCGVLGFYCFAMIFDDPNRALTLKNYFDFIINLVHPFKP
jgi:hypothetical protein